VALLSAAALGAAAWTLSVALRAGAAR
jgi:hypothetical protein